MGRNVVTQTESLLDVKFHTFPLNLNSPFGCMHLLHTKVCQDKQSKAVYTHKNL